MLWVRSQDRKRLTKIEDIYIVVDDNEKDNILSVPKYYIGNTLIGHLGTYLSKERAIEVIDEIQKHIINQGKSFINTNELGIIQDIKHYDCIYEMPEK